MTRFREEAARSGATLPPGDSFTIEKSGVKMSVNYTEDTRALKVCIVEKPASGR